MIKRNNKGFTLAELLIVVAIIAVLVAIAIPVFTSQLANSKEAADAANVRAKYAELVTAAIDGETGSTSISLADLKAVCTNGSNVTYADGKLTVTLTGATKHPTILVGAGVNITGT